MPIDVSACSIPLASIVIPTLLAGSLNGPHIINSRVALESISGISFFNLRISFAGPVAAEVNSDGFI